MKKATFYLIAQLSSQAELESHEWLACQLAAENWRMGKRVLIACEDQIQAEKLDEILWQREPYQFVPHNLAGEGPRYGAPVELCWLTKRGNSARDILINLQSTFANFATAFHEVIDFVPIDENLKQLARERYKTYRSMGFHLIMAPPPTT
ncbi:DNA polymerase III subunit chi [Arsenophonus endosymbiont of Bemisia tabaci Asia II 3]|nr:DNA polymerase III subunit chi [Arsenophonus endosymbiont of Bemisia tabaci Asia II 3]